MGYDLVDVELAGHGLLRVFIDLPPGAVAQDGAASPGVPGGPFIRMEDCEKVSHQLTHVLTVENIDYARLEVSSPGLDRPLRRAADFERFVGSEITLRLREAVSGRRNFTGVLWRDEAHPGGWQLELIETPPAQPAGRGKAGARSGAKAASRPSAKATSGPSPEGGEAAGEKVRTLSFELSDVDRARLVPKVTF